MSKYPARPPLPTMTPRDLELIQEDHPSFVERIDALAAKNRRNPRRVFLKQSLEEYDNHPMLLYACLWYAYEHGVRVTFLPKKRAKNHTQHESNAVSTIE